MNPIHAVLPLSHSTSRVIPDLAPVNPKVLWSMGTYGSGLAWRGQACAYQKVRHLRSR